jgi:hypothetical protein
LANQKQGAVDKLYLLHSSLADAQICFAALFTSLSKVTIHAGAAKPALWHSLSTQFLPFKDLQKDKAIRM